MGVGGQCHKLAGKEIQNPFYRKLGGPQGWSGCVQKISPPPGFDPQTAQPVASHYTDCAIPAHTTEFKLLKYYKLSSGTRQQQSNCHILKHFWCIFKWWPAEITAKTVTSLTEVHYGFSQTLQTVLRSQQILANIPSNFSNLPITWYNAA